MLQSNDLVLILTSMASQGIEGASEQIKNCKYGQNRWPIKKTRRNRPSIISKTCRREDRFCDE